MSPRQSTSTYRAHPTALPRTLANTPPHTHTLCECQARQPWAPYSLLQDTGLRRRPCGPWGMWAKQEGRRLPSPVSQHLPHHLPLPQPQSPYFHVNGRPQPSKLVNQPPAPQRRRRMLTQAHCPNSGSRLPWHLPGLWAWTNPFSGLFIALVPPPGWSL